MIMTVFLLAMRHAPWGNTSRKNVSNEMKEIQRMRGYIQGRDQHQAT